ncbi:cyanophycinase [Pontibacter vulgaris]|uniref:cyanophycinase n=1 Tax=Pontibacter vulgaris TaxID=2905679 RepID=UPI001FA7484F|nr:cyanophycinase [Pontibacter vulgaris]
MAKKRETAKHLNKKEPPVPKGKLLAIGGKEGKGEDIEKTDIQEENKDFIDLQILQRYVDELKGENPLVAVITTASTEPEAAGNDYIKVFNKLGVTNVEIINIKDRADAKKPEYREIIEKAAGIMFTGGDQLRLTAILGGTAILEVMKERYTYEEIIVGGTSAGAAAMSTPMIYEGETQGGMIKGDVRITTGLEFMKNVAIDTHFIARGRIVRMAQAISTNPGCVGIGLEEDTAILVTEGKHIEVVGNGLITVVDGSDISRSTIYEIGNGEPFTVCDLRVHLMADQETFDLPIYDQLHL